MANQNLDALTGQIADMILGSRKLVVFTGAGVSTESGIPDFRSPGGIWDRFDPDDFTYDKFVGDEETRRRQWQMLREGVLTDKAQPNPAHYAIADLDKLGRLDCVITQNIDNLHQKAGLLDDKVFELHGNMQRAVCLSCGRSYPLEEITPRLENGEDVPDCPQCRGMLKPGIVMFGEQLPVAVLEEASRRAMACDMCLVVGSTLVVYPAAYMPIYAVQAGARLAIVNLSETPMDDKASVTIRGKAGETLPLIVEKVKAGL